MNSGVGKSHCGQRKLHKSSQMELRLERCMEVSRNGDGNRGQGRQGQASEKI